MNTKLKGKLIIVRHAESEWNAKGKWTGLYDSPLTQYGHKKSEEMGLRIQDISFDHAMTSVLSRSKQTLASMLKVHPHGIEQKEVTIHETPQFNERDYGDYTGANKWEVLERVGEQEFNTIRRAWDYPIPNGETLKAVYARAVPHFQEHILPLLKEGNNVLIVSHGNAIRALLKYIEKISDEEIGNFEMKFGAIFIYDLDENGHMQSKEERYIQSDVNA